MAGDLPSWAVPVDESKPVAGLPEWAKLAPEPEPVRPEGIPPEKTTTAGQAFMAGIGKAGWAIPSLVGVDAPVAEAFYQALKDRASGRATDLMARYRELEPRFRDFYQTAQREHPVADLGGSAVGQGAMAALTGGAALEAEAPSAVAATLPRLVGMSRAEQAVALAKASGLQGAVAASGQPANNVGERLGNMATGGVAGAALGAGMGAALPPVSPGAAAAQRMGVTIANRAEADGVAGATGTPAEAQPTGVVQRAAQAIAGESNPTADAQFLASKGVRLTRGMRDPGSPANQLEQALQSTHPYGTKIAAQRASAASDFRLAAANEALPPGMSRFPVGTDLGDAVSAIHEGFDGAYGAVGSHPIYPAVHGPGGGPLQGTPKTPGLLEQAVDSVKRLSDSQRGSIKADVADLLTKLPERQGAVGKVDAADLIDMRAIVRQRAREWGASHTPEGTAAKEAYDAVEDQLTAALESQLPADASKLLQQTDAAYRQFKILDSAMQSARGSGGEFTPRQLAMAASQGVRGFRSATGEVGPMHDLAVAAGRIMAPTVKPTGERVAILHTAGQFAPEWVVKRVAGAATTAANRAAMGLDPIPPVSAPSSTPASGWAPQTGWLSPMGLPAGQASVVPPQAAPGQRQGATDSAASPAQSTPAGSVDAIVSRLSADPRMRPYADLLKRAGPQAAPGLHFELYQKDPTYRAAVMAGEQSK